MRHFATIMMFCACLLYGYMPAMAAVPAPALQAMSIIDTADAQTPSGEDAKPDLHSGHTMHGTGNATATKTASAKQQPDRQAPMSACPHCDGTAAMSFCPACLTLPPLLAIDTAAGHIFAYPAPDAGVSLLAFAPAPLEPPPRA